MKVVIIGATSAIAQEVAKIYAAEGASLFLVARDQKKVEAVAADLRVRGASGVAVSIADLADRSLHSGLVAAAGDAIDVVLVAHGSLPAQQAIENDAAAVASAFDLNATSVISIIAAFAVKLEKAKHGTLAVIGSIAGDRGRRSNYIYGSAKAAIATFCEGLRGRLVASNCSVVLAKPGWVDTPMTAGMKKNFLFTSPEKAARVIHSAIQSRRAVVYVPRFWRWISLIVRLLPARMVKF